MTEASRLVDAAQVLLDQVVARFAAEGVALPAKQFVANTTVEGLSLDVEQLATAVQRVYVGTPGAEGDPGSGLFFPLVADLALVLTRCVPTSSTPSGPTAKALGDSARTILTDLSLVASAVGRAAANDAWGCERVRIGGGTPIAPSGGLGGLLYRVSLSI